jgi:hypothetical protein
MFIHSFSYQPRRLFLFIPLTLLLVAGAAFGQGTAFTYQGKLTDGGTPANGNYDLQFALWDSASGGTQIGSTQTVASVSVAGGIFTVTLDFGTSAFPGANRFLEIGVRLAGGGAFTTLAPRQQISSTPYAIRTLNAGAADALSSACVACVQDAQINQVSGSKVNGPIPVASVPAGSANYIQNTTTQQSSANFNIDGNGAAGGTLSGNVVNATTQYNLGGNRVLSAPGTNNFFAGVGAGQANSSGQGNVFAGAGAGQANTNGFHNSFFGLSAGLGSNGVRNSFFGVQAGATGNGGANSGDDNAFFGAFAGLNNKVCCNSFFGSATGGNNISGSGNSFFGYQTGLSNTTGHDNTLIGASADVGSGGLQFATAIGDSAVVSSSHTIVLGTQGEKVVVPGTMLVGQPNPGQVMLTVASIPPLASTGQVCFDSPGNLLQCGASSLRLKRNVQPFRGGLDIIRHLRPISFDWKDGSGHDIGLGAEDVTKVAPSFTFADKKGEVVGVKYDRLNMLLINAVKEQQQQIERQQNQIAALRSANAGLNARLRAVEKSLRKKGSSARRR